MMLVLLISLSYRKAKEDAQERAYEICDKLLSEVEATRAYVREVLEPLMSNLAGDRFIPEVMYTGYVARRTTEIFINKNPEYYMKFAGLNPRNPVNSANELEERIIKYFRENPDSEKWRGISRRNGIEYLTVAIPYRFTEECLRCHGIPENAPPEMIERYGAQNGFGAKVGDVTINSISAPVNLTYADIWHQSLHSLIPMLSLSVIMFLVTTGLFNKLVAFPILKLKKGVENIAHGSYNIRVESTGSDEVNDLSVAFNRMAESLEDNIIKRNKAEEELERVNKELEQIVYVTSHDLRAPLVNVEGYQREIKHSLEEMKKIIGQIDIPLKLNERLSKITEKDIPEASDKIERSLYKMDSLLNALLKLSRTGELRLNIKELDMNILIKDVMADLDYGIKKSGAVVEVSGLPSCKGDETQINQLFSNLLLNAVKYLDPARPGVIKVSGFKQDGHSIYCVEDNGIGIKPEDNDKIFQVFQQIRPHADGEGLGLSIAKKIAERHNGSIRVESEYGNGSRFYVELPG